MRRIQRPVILFMAAGALYALVFMALMLVFPPGARAEDDWIAEARKTPALKAPFRKNAYAGEVGRIAVMKNKALRLTAAEGSNRATVVVIPLKDGKKVGAKEVLRDEPLTLLQSPLESDEFVFKVFTGIVNLEGDADDITEVVLEEGQKGEIRLIPFKEATGRFTNISSFRSTCSYSFFSGEDDISKSNDFNRTITLEFNGSNLTKTWKTAADRIVVEAIWGKVLVRIGQPFLTVK